MSVESMIMMVVVVGGYAVGAFLLLSKVFEAQKARDSERE